MLSNARPTSDGDPGRALEILLRRRTENDPEYWTFEGVRGRLGSHGFFQYPAMMVPELQGALLDDALKADPSIDTVYDPFTGSGTVLVEAMIRGLNFHGTDINPMAILLAQVKATPPSVDAASLAFENLQVALGHTSVPDAVRSFPFSEKWFHPSVALGLTRLRSAIIEIESLELRQYFWVCLAETVRLVSNSRTSTFKLHAYPSSVLASRVPDAEAMYQRVFESNLLRLGQHWARVSTERPPTASPHAVLLQGSALAKWTAPRLQADVLMTSPPYGDNKTTVPYGQHSYLPLQWIDTGDIPGGFDPILLTSTAKIDSMSLGGSLAKAEKLADEMCDVSPALANFLPLLGDRQSLRSKVVAFAKDYRDALSAANSRLRPGGFSFFTLGERRVGGQLFPLVEITQELLLALQHDEVALLTRSLPRGSKRMALRNSEGATMATEVILVTRRRLNSN